jgi:hypothetical protein
VTSPRGELTWSAALNDTASCGPTAALDFFRTISPPIDGVASAAGNAVADPPLFASQALSFLVELFFSFFPNGDDVWGGSEIYVPGVG